LSNKDEHFNRVHHSYTVAQLANRKCPDISTAIAVVVVIVNFINFTRKNMYKYTLGDTLSQNDDLPIALTA
jgi:hypothetical protein